MANEYKDYVCVDCGHEILIASKPQPIRWSDGHVCYFVESKPTIEERKESK